MKIPTLLLIVTICAMRLYGQAASGTISGTLTDQAGAPIAGASINITNEATDFSRTVATNQSGQYSAQFFPIGPVRITVEQPGFQKLVRTGAVLTAADILTVDLQLALGNVQQSIEVNAAATVLQTQTQTVSSLVTNQQLAEIPLNQRIFTQVLQLIPGATSSTPNPQAGGTYGLLASNAYSINGSQSSNNSYLIDGMYNRGLWLNNLAIVPPLDGLQEVRVLASDYSSEFGAAAGAVTLAYSKSGTNAFHGGGFEFLQNTILNANTFFNNRSGAPRSQTHKNQFGGTLGGPIRKDKTFFFMDYQGYRVRNPSSSTNTIPTVAQRNAVLTGDFTGVVSAVYDPYNVITGPNGNPVRAPFPGNRIPATLLDPAVAKFMPMVPLPQNSSSTRNFTYSPSATQRTDQFDVRGDQNMGSADRIFFKYTYISTDSLSPGSVPSVPVNGIPVGPYIAGGGTFTTFRNWSATLNYTKVINASTVNEVRIGGVRWAQDITPPNSAYNTAAALGIPNININDHSGGFPALAVTGFVSFDTGATYPEFSRSLSMQYEDILTMTRGSHTLKFGGLYIRHRLNGYSAYPTRGNYTFNGQFTSQIGSPSSSAALADFALGAGSAITRSIFDGVFGLRFSDAAGFVDDSWRVTNRLTLNVGVRYELETPPYEVNNRWVNLNLNTGLAVLPNDPGQNRSLRNLDTNNLAPRVGFAYSLTPKTVLRSGFGVTYVEGYNVGNQMYKNLPYFFSQIYAFDAAGTPGLTLSQGIPIPTAPPVTDRAALASTNMQVYDFDTKMEKMLQWSLGVQRQISDAVSFEVSYIGSRGIDLLSPVAINQAFPGPGPLLPRRPLYLSGVNQSIGSIRYASNVGDSKYHSFQTRFNIRTWHGLTTSVAYTWAHYLSDIGQITGGSNIMNARCYSCEMANDPTDRRHVLIVNHVYEVPLGHGHQYLATGALGKIVGNWQLSGIWSLMTGTYFTPTLATGVTNTAEGSGLFSSGAERPNCSAAGGNLDSSQRSIDRWFNVGAYSIPQTYTFGNCGPYTLLGPAYFNADLGVHRIFSVTERVRLTFRWEMFNAFNHANFSNPNASIGASTAGQISATQPARSMQLALKATF